MLAVVGLATASTVVAKWAKPDGATQAAHQPPAPAKHTTSHARATHSSEQNLVGFEMVALPLPEGWTLNDLACGDPQSDTVVVQPPDATLACMPPLVEGISSIVLDDLTSATAKRWKHTATETYVLADGTSALRGRTTDERGLAITVVVVPAYSAIAVGFSPLPQRLDEALSQITQLSKGEAAVPQLVGKSWDAAAQQLKDLGLAPVRRDVPSSNRGEVVGSSPTAGRVEEQGSTVIVDVGVWSWSVDAVCRRSTHGFVSVAMVAIASEAIGDLLASLPSRTNPPGIGADPAQGQQRGQVRERVGARRGHNIWSWPLVNDG